MVVVVVVGIDDGKISKMMMMVVVDSGRCGRSWYNRCRHVLLLLKGMKMLQFIQRTRRGQLEGKMMAPIHDGDGQMMIVSLDSFQ